MNSDISSPVLKVDNKEKINGTAEYIRDIKFENMMYAQTLRSDRPRAKIMSVDTPEIPDGYYIVDRRDITGENRVKIIFDDQPIFAEEVVNYVGEPILLVVGENKEVLQEIILKTRIKYEDITPIFTIDEAIKAAAKPIFGKDNCFSDYSFNKGNLDKMIKNAAQIVCEEFTTGYQEHVYLEPQGVTAICENNKVTVYGSFQCPYYVKSAVVQALGCEPERVRVVQTTTGGAFGGKEEFPSLIACQAAIAAIKTKRPIQLAYDRCEDILYTTKRHPSIIGFKTALDKDKNIIGMDIDVKLNAGAHATLSSVVLQRAMFAITGVYKIKNLRVRGRAFATNYVPSGAFRGFGCPQAIFAIETHLNHIAVKNKIDPIEFKVKHFVQKGDLTCTEGIFRYEVKLPQMLQKIYEMSNYKEKIKVYENNTVKKQRGIGCAFFLHGCGFTGSGEQDHIKSEVKLRKTKEQYVEILVANVDMGQGLLTTFKKIVSTTLDISFDRIIYNNPDTDKVPDSGPTVASRTIMIVGRLLELACLKLKDKWNDDVEVEVVEKYKQPEFVKWNQEHLSGDAYPTYSWGINVVEVEVDTLTYEISVLGVWSIFDIGRAIDEKIVLGQIEGGVLQGLGYGTIEVMESKEGRFVQKNITDYIIPTSKDICNMEIELMDNPYDNGPYGAKGVGELTLVGSAPALVHAVENALGINICKIPVTPEYLMEVVENEERD